MENQSKLNSQILAKTDTQPILNPLEASGVLLSQAI